MSRILLAALAALLLLVPATASGSSSARLRGTVAAKLSANELVRVESRRFVHILRVPGSQARIHVGQSVELRGSMLRKRGRGSRVLARNASSRAPRAWTARTRPAASSRRGMTTSSR